MLYTVNNTTLEKWAERDRVSVYLYDTDDNSVMALHDEDFHQAIEDGFINPRNLHQTTCDYANHLYGDKNEHTIDPN